MKKLVRVFLFFAAVALVAPTAQAFVLAEQVPGKWGPPTDGTGATVTWSLTPTGSSCASELDFGVCTITSLADFMPAGFLTQIQNAFTAWSAVANINFVQIADDGAAFDAATSSGDIRLGGHVFDGQSRILAHGYFPPDNGLSAAGDIHFDIAEVWKIGFGGPGFEFDIFQIAAHEIGHAIGLSHTGVPNSLLNPFYTEAFSGPQADDIAGAVFLYGARVAVPAPGLAALLAIGFLALGLLRRLRV